MARQAASEIHQSRLIGNAYERARNFAHPGSAANEKAGQPRQTRLITPPLFPVILNYCSNHVAEISAKPLTRPTAATGPLACTCQSFIHGDYNTIEILSVNKFHLHRRARL